MNIQSYLDLYQLIESDSSTKERRRSFGLAHTALKEKPIEQLMAWLDSNASNIPHPSYSHRFSSYLYRISFLLLVIAFGIGFFAGLALLHYNGKAPVNVVYFMAMVIFFPLLTMLLSLLSMAKSSSSQSVLVHLSPAYWLEKITTLLSKRFDATQEMRAIDPRIANWLIIQRAQLLALTFSIGLAIALIVVIVTQDIAFAWSTTLQMPAEGFYRFTALLSLPWHEIFPSAVPSMALIEQSHYFRLGDRLSGEMIANASVLGQWWKFLLMATLFYAIFLRLLLYWITSLGLKRAIRSVTLALEGVDRLLADMNEPIISTHAIEKVEVYEVEEGGAVERVEEGSVGYAMVQGWSISHDEMICLNDLFSISAQQLYSVGGSNSIKDDSIIISKSEGEVLLYVKAWEPPTMDFIDYLEELLEVVDRVVIAPIGTQEHGYIPVEKSIKVWERKLSLFDNPNISFQVSKVADNG
jgi:hypothetical protein